MVTTAPVGTPGYGNVDGPAAPQAVSSYGAPSAAYPQGGDPYAATAYGQPSPDDVNKWNNAVADNKWQAQIQQYVDAFNHNISGQRNAIDANLTQSLGALSGRRDAANAVVAQMPAQIASNYNFAAGLQQTPGGHYSSDVQQNVGKVGAGEMAALGADKAAANSGNPFLNLAVRANYDAGTAALQQQKAIGNQDLNDQANQFLMKVMDEKTQHQQSVDDRSAQWAHDDQVRRQEEASRQAWATNPSNPDSIPGKESLYKDTQPSGKPLLAQQGITQKQENDIVSSPEYNKWVSFITNKTSAGNKADPNQVIQVLQKSNPALLAVLQVDHPEFFYKGGSPVDAKTQGPAQLNSNLVQPGGINYLGTAMAAMNPLFASHDRSIWNAYLNKPS